MIDKSTIVSQQALSHSVQHSDGRLEDVILDYRRAVYRPEHGTLLVADLHWGKGETFRHWGIPIPGTVFSFDMQRLAGLVEAYNPKKIVVLGDLIHGKYGLTADLINTIQTWRQQYPVSMSLVLGNHDRVVKSVREHLQHWSIDWHAGPLEEDGFIYSHEPLKGYTGFNWYGHIHPTFRMKSPGDVLRLPCFHIGNNFGILPAFNVFTGGFNIVPQLGEAIYVTGDDFLIKI